MKVKYVYHSRTLKKEIELNLPHQDNRGLDSCGMMVQLMFAGILGLLICVKK